MQISTWLLAAFGLLTFSCQHSLPLKMPQARSPQMPSARRPASALPAGYQVKDQDSWALNVWHQASENDFLGSCRIRKTAQGFEAGSSADASGAANMQTVKDAHDLGIAQHLAELTGQGFEIGDGPYWTDCVAKGAKKKCTGDLRSVTFSEFQGRRDYASVEETSTPDVFDERTVTIERGAGFWASSAVAHDINASVKCLCAHYARPEEQKLFPAGDCPGL